MKKILAIVTVMLLVSAPVIAQDMCVGDFDYDGDCDGTDAARFKQDFGRSIFENPCPPPNLAPSLIPKTGQTISYATGDDGDLEKGVLWPNPRFADNADGTVTDNLTGLTWLKNANCFGTRLWNNALSDCNGLASGSCGLTDGSSSGDWRLPNRFELESLLDLEYYLPALSNTDGTGQWSEGDPFTNVKYEYNYWSSTAAPDVGSVAWFVSMEYAEVFGCAKTYCHFYVWPVRDPL